jgi:hypothetical protein
MTTQFRELLQQLSLAGVEFIVVGGVAAAAHGSAFGTNDLDVVYRRSDENMTRLVRVLSALQPYPRGAPEGLPFRWDDRTIRFGENFTLRTSLGFIDLLGQIAGGGAYDSLLPFTIEVEIHGTRCLCLDLGKLIETKRAAGRPKDYQVVAELEAIRDDSEGQSRA